MLSYVEALQNAVRVVIDRRLESGDVVDVELQGQRHALEL